MHGGDIINALMEYMEGSRFSELKKALSETEAVDIAEFIEQLDSEKILVIFRLMPKDICAEVFAYLSAGLQQHVILSITDNEVRQLVNELFVDDTVDMLEEVPAGVVKKILRNLNEETREIVNQFLKYEPNTAGSIMTSEFVEFRMNITVKNAIDAIRHTALDKETVYSCYVINQERKLKGVVSLRTLLLSEDHTLVQDIMNKNVISVKTGDDQEYVADLIRRYDYISIPVVDSEERLVGIVTVDDAMDVIQSEYDEDFAVMAAITPSEEEYLRSGIWSLSKKRIVWLMLLMLSATFTGTIISYFEDVLSAMIILTSFIPMLTDTGGNAGSQSATLVIRGLAVNEIKTGDFLQVLWKELRVSLVCGSILAAINFLRLVFISRVDVMVSLVVCISVAITVVVAKVIGGLLPIAASKLKLDPAIMASPLITTIVDALALIIYFLLAVNFLSL